jgi:hypothetical protein
MKPILDTKHHFPMGHFSVSRDNLQFIRDLTLEGLQHLYLAASAYDAAGKGSLGDAINQAATLARVIGTIHHDPADDDTA